MESVKIKFAGAASTVTGSKYILSIGNRNLLVDCGLFQGLKDLRLRNWTPLSVDASKIDAVVLTHAHIDHSGFIPRLVKDGFRGKVFCTPATAELCGILLPDTGNLQEEEAGYLNKRKLSKHDPALALFSEKDAHIALKQFFSVNFDQEFEVIPGVTCEFKYAGHILGAAMAVLRIGKMSVGFSGDLGRQSDPIFKKPAPMPEVDYLIVESTYGDTVHPTTDPSVSLEKVAELAFQKRSVVLIPSFAVGRAQTLVHLIAQLKKQKRLPPMGIYLNSPMATDVTKIFCENRSLHKLSVSECNAFSDVVEYVRSPEESQALNEKKGPMIIISASGMATGGRILHHLKAFAPDLKNYILLTGFQAAGTRGRSLQDGAREIKIHGEMVPVRAEVQVIENLSAHADVNEIMTWLKDSNIHPKKVFVTHGEINASLSLKKHLTESFGWNCIVPELNQEFELGSV